METIHDRFYIDARETLLDAVDALGRHGNAAILVGAQAIYVHTEGEDTSFAISPFTYDADLVLDPEQLAGSPAIVEAMSRAGFHLGDQPGLYGRKGRSQVDLLVPEAVGGPGRRAARLGVHGNRAAMKVRGLEGALVSHEGRKITSLVPGADRSCFLKVAGPAALVVSKVYKIGDRSRGSGCPPSRTAPQGRIRHISDYYVLQTQLELGSEFLILLSHDISSLVYLPEALSMFQRLFGSRSGHGDKSLGQGCRSSRGGPRLHHRVERRSEPRPAGGDLIIDRKLFPNDHREENQMPITYGRNLASTWGAAQRSCTVLMKAYTTHTMSIARNIRPVICCCSALDMDRE